MTVASVTNARLTLLGHIRGDRMPMSLAEHRTHHPAPPPPGAGPWTPLIELIERAGLGGRGGAGFPTARKWRAVAARRAPRSVVVNGAEGEPASGKDRLLLASAPHLVIDGALFAAAAVGASRVILAVDGARGAALESGRRAVAERLRVEPPGVELAVEAAPSRYVAGESSAVVRWLDGGPAKPSGVPAHESGIAGGTTLVQNVETLAHVAQIATYGPDWFRSQGTADEPGTALVTVTGAVRRPAIVEVAWGTPTADLIDQAGGLAGRAQALLVGGFYGTWVPAALGLAAPFSRAGLARLGASAGAGVVLVLPDGACGLAETARLLRWFSAEGAGQCGPCVHGLPALAEGLACVARGVAGPSQVARLRRWAAEIDGRGACRHPDGATALLRSALAVFAADLDHHARGIPCRGAGTTYLRVP